MVTLNHFTAPHWFAMRSGWLDPEAPALFARYCDKVVERFGDRIAYAVTLNEPNLAHLLTWFPLPDFIKELDRATLAAASEAAGVPAYRLANVALPEEMDALEDGMAAGHVAARAAIKARRPELPVGFSLAIMDDVVVGDDPSVRDRKRAEVYQRWLELARDDDFLGVQNYEQVPFDGNGVVPPPEDATKNLMGTEVEPLSLAGAVRYGHEVAGVPVLVTEHGMGTPDDALRAAFIEPSLRRAARRDRRGRPGAGLLPLVAARQLRVDLRLRLPVRAARGRPHDLRAHGQAERRGVRRDRAGRRRVGLRLRRRASPGGGRPGGAAASRRDAAG